MLSFGINGDENAGIIARDGVDHPVASTFSTGCGRVGYPRLKDDFRQSLNLVAGCLSLQQGRDEWLEVLLDRPITATEPLQLPLERVGKEDLHPRSVRLASFPELIEGLKASTLEIRPSFAAGILGAGPRRISLDALTEGMHEVEQQRPIADGCTFDFGVELRGNVLCFSVHGPV